MPDQVQLIAYADRLGGTLPALGRLLDGPLAGLFGGVHLLPFYRPFDGADAGFDPVDHLEVDPRLGTWSDIAALAQGRGIVADLIVNHVSDRSVPFRDVVSRGDASPSAGMFLSYDRVFPGGATEAELLRIVRPRPGLPFTPIVLGDRPQLLWTTFTPHQIDLDVRDPAARVYLSRVLLRLAECGVSMVRLDAVGYTVKTAGTSCFLTPDTFAFVDELAAEAHGLGLEVLAEVHAHHRFATEAAAHVDRVYDFALAPLVLHTVFTGDAAPLRRWLTTRPHNAVTVLDTHDGIDDESDGGAAARPGADRGASWRDRTQQRRSERASAESGGRSTRSAARPTTRWAATIGATFWRDCCSCSPPGSRRSTTSACSPGTTWRSPATPERSTADGTPRRT